MATHVSPFSGTWYPDDPAEIRAMLDRAFAESERRTGRFAALASAGFIVPHAGLKYSGMVAAAVYRQIRALAPDRVILLGFPHHGAKRGVWIPPVASYETPLGTVAVDREFADALASSGAPFGALDEDELCDHSVEIQLPLLQVAVPGCRVVPVYVSRLRAEERHAAARALAAQLTPGTLIVASSDFTHYGRAFSYQPFPPDDAAHRLRELDESVIDALGTLNAEEFLRTLRETGSTVCGYDPIALLLETIAARANCDEVFLETLDYQTSGEITGDFEQSVSYAALGCFPASALELSRTDQDALLTSARRTLAHYATTGERRRIPAEGGSPALEHRAGAFVTLHSGGELRGCVGRREGVEPLSHLVPSLALSAALDDPRFDSMRRGESFDVEISVLTPMKRLLHPSQFRAGEHGAWLEAGPHRGLLLPQVATEYNWGAAQFLEALDRKAGAPRKAHCDPSSRLYVFRAQVFR